MANAKNEAKIKFTAETKEFSDAITHANKDISTMKSELRVNAVEMKNNGISVEGLVKKQELLQKQQVVTKNKTQALEKQLDSAKRIYGEDSEEVAKLTQKLNASKIAESNLDKQLRNTNDEIKQQKKQMGLSAESAEKLKSGLNKVGNASKVVTGGIVATGIGAVAAFNAVDDGADQVIKKTGTTGKQAEKLEQIYKDVAKNIVGDYANIGNAIGEVNTKFHLERQELQETTEKYLKFANVNETDVVSSIDKAYQAQQKWNLSNDETMLLLDQITKRSQNTGISIDSIFQGIDDNSAILKEMKFNVNQSVEFLADLEVSGINASDGFKAMKFAIKNATNEGTDLNSFLTKNVEKIKGAKSETEALSIATATFGNKNAPEMAKAIREGRLTLDGFIKSTKKYSGTVEKTFEQTLDGEDKVELAMQNIQIGVAEIGETILEEIEPNIDKFVNSTKAAVKWSTENGDKIVTTMKTIGTVAGTVFAVNKVAKFGRSIADISKGTSLVVKGIYNAVTARTAEKVATEAQAVAQKGLNASMLASPISLTVAGVAALAAGIVILNEKSKEASEETKAYIEEQRTKSEEAKKAIDDLTNSLENHDREVQKTYGSYEHQLRLLDEMVDKDGKIKKGKEEQVKIITGELSEALGVEIDVIDGQVKGYKKLEKQIKKTIEQKKIEALLEAGKEDWATAIQTRSEYKGKVDTQKKEVDKAKRELDTAQTSRNVYLNQNPFKRLQQELTTGLGSSTKKNLDEALNKYNEATKTYNNTMKTYEESGDVIGRYETLLAASTSKSTKELKTALTGYINNMKNAKSATLVEIEQQVETTKIGLEKIRGEYKKGNVSKEVLDEHKRANKFAKEQLKIKLQEIKGEQKKEADEYKKDNVPNAAKGNAKRTVDAVKSMLKLANFGNEGEKGVRTFTERFTDSKGKKAGKNILGGINQKFGSANFSLAGKKAVSTFTNSFTGLKGINAGNTVAKGINVGLKNYFKKNPFNLDVQLNAKIKSKNKNLTDLQNIVFHNAKGNIVKSPILTTFAENGPEAAIPIDKSFRSKALWLKTGEMMGMINSRIGNQKIEKDSQLAQTNALLALIVKKDSNLYVNGMKVSQATASSRDYVDGINVALEGRGMTIG